MSWYNSNGETAINIVNGLTMSLAGFSMLFLPSDYSKSSFFPIVFGAIMFVWYYGRKNHLELKNSKDTNKLTEDLYAHRKLLFHLSLIPYYIYFIIIVLVLGFNKSVNKLQYD
jgi:hypothetical protein